MKEKYLEMYNNRNRFSIYSNQHQLEDQDHGMELLVRFSS